MSRPVKADGLVSIGTMKEKEMVITSVFKVNFIHMFFLLKSCCRGLLIEDVIHIPPPLKAVNVGHSHLQRASM